MRTGSAPPPLLLAACALAAIAIALAACSADASPSPVPAPPPSVIEDAAAPLFATDEEALAAAEEAYAAYLAASDAVLARGGAGAALLDDVAIGQALEFERTGAADFAANGLHSSGTTSFRTHRLQSVRRSDEWAVEIRAYVCDDLSEVDLLDAAGTSTAMPDRPVRIPFLVAVVGDHSTALKVAEKELWVDGNFC